MNCNRHSNTGHRPPAKGARAFSLLEVLLAVAIAAGLMMVVLFFYRQAGLLRTEVLEQAEQISTVRMVMDRLTSELRSAVAHEYMPSGLVGDSNFIMFVRAALPGAEAWVRDGAATELQVVSYALPDLSGLRRTEEPLTRPIWEEDALAVGDEDSEMGLFEQWGDGEASLLTDRIRHVRFRYWNGWWWQDRWERWDLPMGVEVSLGTEAWPEDEETYPHELFRRVIHVPGNGSNDGMGVLELFGAVAGKGGEKL